MPLAILIVLLIVLVVGLVVFNIFTSKKRKIQKVDTPSANVKADSSDEKSLNTTIIKQAEVKTEKKELKGLFNKKDENKKRKITCPSCGVEVEVYDGSGRCPYCGANFVKK